MPTITSNMGLAVVSRGEALSSSVSLATHGTTNSGVFSAVDLHLHCGNDGATISRGFPLALGGSNTDSLVSSIPLAIHGRVLNATNSVELSLFNNQSIVASGVSLFVAGSGNTPGALNVTSHMPLFIQRNTDAATTLFLKVEGNPASGTPVSLYVRGGLPANSGLPLAVPYGVGGMTATAPLYVGGF